VISKEDEDEDYMDESTVNKEGGAWPFVLKFVVCQLLMEITAYIRETYKSVPKVQML
jgi:protein unc-80